MKYLKAKIGHTTVGAVLAWTTLLTAGCLIGLYTYWMLYPYDPIHFDLEEFPVENMKVRPGEQVTFVLHGTNTVAGVVAFKGATLVDGVMIQYPQTSYIPKLGKFNVQQQFKIPSYVSPGKFYIRIDYSVPVNPVRNVSESTRTVEFTVIK